jgi:hypothetical protein
MAVGTLAAGQRVETPFSKFPYAGFDHFSSVDSFAPLKETQFVLMKTRAFHGTYFSFFRGGS